MFNATLSYDILDRHFGKSWSLHANLGASVSDMFHDALKNRDPIADGLITDESPGLANVFNIQNLSNSDRTVCNQRLETRAYRIVRGRPDHEVPEGLQHIPDLLPHEH